MPLRSEIEVSGDRVGKPGRLANRVRCRRQVEMTLTQEIRAFYRSCPTPGERWAPRRDDVFAAGNRGTNRNGLPLHRVRKESNRMKWVLLMIGSAGLLAGGLRESATLRLLSARLYAAGGGNPTARAARLRSTDLRSTVLCATGGADRSSRGSGHSGRAAHGPTGGLPGPATALRPVRPLPISQSPSSPVRPRWPAAASRMLGRCCIFGCRRIIVELAAGGLRV